MKLQDEEGSCKMEVQKANWAGFEDRQASGIDKRHAINMTPRLLVGFWHF